MKENQQQQTAIKHAAGPMQVLAGPGSGKTYTIVKRIRHLIEAVKVPPSAILVITFTKAAAWEMQMRFLKEIGASHSAVCFGTFHSVFYHILKQSANRSGTSSRQYSKDYTLISNHEKIKVMKIILKNLPSDHQNNPENENTKNHPESYTYSSDEITNILAEISRIKNREDGLHGFESQLFDEPEIIALIYDQYQELLQAAGKIDFDDMLLYCRELLKCNPGILKRWQQTFTYLMVDEFQDINGLQYQIIKMLAAPENNLFVVGDDDQSIYGFRGAHPGIMIRFLADFPQCRQVVLDTNYRSTASVVTASAQVIACNKERIAKTPQALKEGPPVLIKALPTNEEEGQYLIETIQAMLPEIREDSAVILRTNHEASGIALKLIEKSIPVRIKERPKDLFSHFILQDILDYLFFAEGDTSRSRYLNIINKPVRYISRQSAADNEIDEAQLLAYYAGQTERQIVIRRFFADIRRLSRMSLFLAINYIRKGIGYDRYLKEKGTKSNYEEWLATADLIQESARGQQTIRQWLDTIENYTKISQISASPDAPQTGITLATMHGSKGLEFHTVLLPHLNQGKLPSKQAHSEQLIEEERRLFYVAMTRAKEQLILTYTASAKSPPSDFLNPLLNPNREQHLISRLKYRT